MAPLKPSSSHHVQTAATAPLAGSRGGPLAALVGDVDHFAQSSWGQRAQLMRGDSALLSLLSIDDVDSLLAHGLRRPHFRVLRDGVTLPASEVTRRVRTGGVTVDDFADPDRIADLLAEGGTLVLQGLEHIRPQVADFAAGLTLELGHRVQANAYLSPPSSAGLVPHTDSHDVFAVQLLGRKLWTVDGLDEAATERGDVLYIPSGVRHAARTNDSWSLHLTVGVHSISVGAVLRRAVERIVAAEPTMSRPLPIAFGDGARRTATAELRGALGDLMALLADSDFDALLDAEAAAARRSSEARTRLGTSGRLASLVASRELTLESVTTRSAAMTVEAIGPDLIRIAGGRRALTMPARVRPAVERLLSEPPCVIGEIPELDDESRLVLARRLLSEGLVGRTPR